MPNKTPENLGLIQKAVLAAESAFYKLFPGAKNTYNAKINDVVSPQTTTLAPLPEAEDMKALYEQNTMRKKATEESSSLALPEFLEAGKQPNVVKPLTKEEILRIRRVHTGLGTKLETVTIPNSNKNNSEILSA